jgi:hypothetical protein
MSAPDCRTCIWRRGRRCSRQMYYWTVPFSFIIPLMSLETGTPPDWCPLPKPAPATTEMEVWLL